MPCCELAHLGPRRLLCVVVVTMSACSKGEGTRPTAAADNNTRSSSRHQRQQQQQQDSMSPGHCCNNQMTETPRPLNTCPPLPRLAKADTPPPLRSQDPPVYTINRPHTPEENIPLLPNPPKPLSSSSPSITCCHQSADVGHVSQQPGLVLVSNGAHAGVVVVARVGRCTWWLGFTGGGEVSR